MTKKPTVRFDVFIKSQMLPGTVRSVPSCILRRGLVSILQIRNPTVLFRSIFDMVNPTGRSGAGLHLTVRFGAVPH